MALFTRKTKARQVAPSSTVADLEARTHQIGTELLEHARGQKAGLLSARFYSDKLMNWAMKDHNFKVQMFRFVDVFPTLTTPDMIHEHLVDYLSQPGVKLPPGMDLGLKAGGVAKGLFSITISGQIKGMGEKFIAGTDAASAHPRLEQLWKHDIGFSVDLLGEACVSDAEADEYLEKYLDLVNNLPERVSGWPAKDLLEKDHIGVVPRTNVSIKISSLGARVDPIDIEGSINDLMRRIEPIVTAAKQKGVLINFDMEQFELKDLTIELFMRACEQFDFDAGIAIQAYLKSGDEDARRIAEWSKRVGRVATVRLIKGAYWDFETIHAEEMGWPCPVWNKKWQTDACFERMARTFLDATPRQAGEGGTKLALGSHNVRSIASAMAYAESIGLTRPSLELQMLHGMADELKHAAASMEIRVREYVPVGEMIPGMAYLVRRLLENTSNESWLVAGFGDNAPAAELLVDPNRKGEGSEADLAVDAANRHQLSPAVDGVGDGKPFTTEPLRDFADAYQREVFGNTVASTTPQTVEINATTDDADKALAEASAAFNDWRDRNPIMRSAMLVKAASEMRARRDELSAIVVKESGKTWRSADADVCEAIDFCEYYARYAPKLFERERLGRFIGELDEVFYQPRGVAAVISPWNFPLAIASGMVSAALVTGNTAILKPAEQTPAIAKELCEILWRAGVPKEALHLLPGQGETVGAKLVRDPRVALIAFTGSKAVGLNILEAAGVTPGDQMHVKKVVCEMGGKNAVIVDVQADLDEAVLGVRESAFGFQGQKCSACSRVIVVDPQGPNGPHTELFVRRFVESTRALVIGDPTSSGTDIGPVIDQEAAAKIKGFIQKSRDEGLTEALSMDVPDGLEAEVGMPYVGPHIFTGVTEEHTIASEEVFGPVVAVMHAPNYEEALRIANSTAYKLTGGVFSRMPKHIERAKRDYRVGNLYINRNITGALVGRQPFGGFGMSGVGSKAGGADYLLQFVEPRAICENTMRRGFAPEL